MNNHLTIIFGMAVVTYIPRLIPFLLVKEKKMPIKIQRFLEYIPYTALGALIVPGVFTAVKDHYFVALAGIVVAFVLSWKKGGMILPVLGSIGTTFIILNILR